MKRLTTLISKSQLRYLGRNLITGCSGIPQYPPHRQKIIVTLVWFSHIPVLRRQDGMVYSWLSSNRPVVIPIRSVWLVHRKKQAHGTWSSNEDGGRRFFMCYSCRRKSPRFVHKEIFHEQGQGMVESSPSQAKKRK